MNQFEPILLKYSPLITSINQYSHIKIASRIDSLFYGTQKVNINILLVREVLPSGKFLEKKKKQNGTNW